MGTWFNDDALYVKLGDTEATAGTSGEYRTNGPLRMIETTLTLSTLTATAAIIEDNVFIPIGARIERVDVVTITAATGATAVLNVGFSRNADRSTAIDADGFVAALPVASMDTAGETTSLYVGSTYAGSSIGLTTATYVGVLTADYDTAAFTAGKVAIRIYWSNPT